MNRKIAVLAILVLLMSAVSVFAQSVRIDYRMNVRAADPSGNYLKWSLGSLNVSDALDTATGASKMKSTAQFDAVRYDSADTKQAAIPGGLRSLMLFPIADWNTAVSDSLLVGTNGKQVLIRYVHRGNAYEFRTDTNGKLDILTGCKIAAGIADNNNNTFVLKPAYLKPGQDPQKMSNLDWTKIRLANDKFSPTATRHYEGKLDVAYVDGILTIKGTLTEKKK
ncbi:MAG: hypothetical protein LBV20_02290 [Treponema sp.]|jgi:hypothetical protein|nr:hypothetical protein [Treponema sp.]